MDFLALIQSQVSASGTIPGWPSRFRIALSGGATPKLFYQRLTQSPYREQIPWDKLWFFWGDERTVPKEHPDSNFGMADSALLSKVPVRSGQVFRIRGEEAPPQSAREYEAILRNHFGSRDEWPAFDLILLGLGADGHTASLFTGSPALQEYGISSLGRRKEDRMAEAYPAPRWVVHNVVRALQTVRITMTMPVINQSKNVWFMVTGLKKAAVFARAQEKAGYDCPASLVRPLQGDLRWYVDKAVLGNSAG